jgi:ribonucleotide monophosphatase NagD (HAD superfamily)
VGKCCKAATRQRACPRYLLQVGAVVVGFDRYINYYKIQYATLCVRENPGCLFIATNRDAVTHLTDAQEWAGNGSMVGRPPCATLLLRPGLAPGTGSTAAA